MWNALLQETKKLFNFLRLQLSNLSGVFTFSHRVFRATAGGESQHSARIGPSRQRRSQTVMLSGSLWCPMGSSMFPSSLPCSSPSFSSDPPLGGFSTRACWRSIQFMGRMFMIIFIFFIIGKVRMVWWGGEWGGCGVILFLFIGGSVWVWG